MDIGDPIRGVVYTQSAVCAPSLANRKISWLSIIHFKKWAICRIHSVDIASNVMIYNEESALDGFLAWPKANADLEKLAQFPPISVTTIIRPDAAMSGFLSQQQTSTGSSVARQLFRKRRIACSTQLISFLFFLISRELGAIEFIITIFHYDISQALSRECVGLGNHLAGSTEQRGFQT